MSQADVLKTLKAAAPRALLVETIQGQTGLPLSDVTTALVMLQLDGQAQEVGGRWAYTGKPTGQTSRGTPPKRAPTRSGNGKAVKVRKVGKATGESNRGTSPSKGVSTVRKGKNWTAKRGSQATSKARPYPLQVCSKRWKDPVTQQFTRAPSSEPRAGTARKGRTSAALTVKTKNNQGEVTGVRAILGAFRRGQERGQISKKQVREAEHQAGREALAEIQERQEVDRFKTEMRAQYNSDKAKRGAATRKRNKAAGVGPRRRAPDLIQRDILRTEELVRAAQRRHEVARTFKSRQKASDMLKSRRLKLDKLRRELAQVNR